MVPDVLQRHEPFHNANISDQHMMLQLTAGFRGIISPPDFSANPKGIVSSSPGLRGTSYPGSGESECPNPNGVASHRSRQRHNPVGVDADSTTVSQGSSCLATLGFEPESRWDSIPDTSHALST